MGREVPEGEKLYDAILDRVADVLREWGANQARYLPRYLTVGKNGPQIPGVSARVCRRAIRKMGRCFAKTQ